MESLSLGLLGEEGTHRCPMLGGLLPLCGVMGGGVRLVQGQEDQTRSGAGLSSSVVEQMLLREVSHFY